jgi:hypothetical protein
MMLCNHISSWRWSIVKVPKASAVIKPRLYSNYMLLFVQAGCGRPIALPGGISRPEPGYFVQDQGHDTCGQCDPGFGKGGHIFFLAALDTFLSSLKLTFILRARGWGTN